MDFKIVFHFVENWILLQLITNSMKRYTNCKLYTKTCLQKRYLELLPNDFLVKFNLILQCKLYYYYYVFIFVCKNPENMLKNNMQQSYNVCMLFVTINQVNIIMFSKFCFINNLYNPPHLFFEIKINNILKAFPCTLTCTKSIQINSVLCNSNSIMHNIST